MNQDDDTDAGGDLFISIATVVIAMFFFVLAITIIGGIVWGLLA